MNLDDRSCNFLPMSATIPRSERPDGRRVRGDRTRAAVLEQAAKIAGIEGLEGITFGRVALVANVPKSTLANLFQDREDLQLQTLRFGADAFAAALRAKMRARRGALGALKALCDAWFQLLEDEEFPGGCIVTAVAGEYRARPGAIQSLVTEYREIWRQALLSATMQAKGEGALAPNADPQQIVFEIVAFQEAAHVRTADRLRAQRAVSALIDRIQRGS